MVSPAVKYVVVGAAAVSLLAIVVTVRMSRQESTSAQGCLYHFPSFELPSKVMDALPAERRNGPLFELSQCYPQQLTDEPLPWVVDGSALDYRSASEARAYLGAILKYAYAGNLEVNWVVQQNLPVRWFHAPWLHFGGTGREPLHGLTYELASEPRTLDVQQDRTVQNWAVSVYNARGGYVLGQVWKGVRHPNPDTLPHPETAIFPNGTVAIKLLFTEATKDEVRYLSGQEGFEWEAYIYEKLPKDPRRPDPMANRRLERLRLLQVDVAVRDDRSQTGWVFGTFVYKDHLAVPPYPGCEPKESPWCKVVPVGLMWGNDPTLTVEEPNPSNPPAESIFIDPGMLPTELVEANKGRVGLGRGGRLNGPVDDKKSSCLSCHATASWPQFDRVPPQGLVTEKQMYWFRNFNVGAIGSGKQSFWPGTEALDYSLQLSSGLRNFHSCRGAIPVMADCQPLPIPTPSPAASPPPASPAGDTFRPQVFRGSDN